ncbi:MAG TPA: cation-translocating P-type ATPase, partial [Gemmatimonadales bacterium]
ILARQFRSVMAVLLLVAASAAYVLGDVADALAILAVLLVNVVIGFVMELRAHRAVESLLTLEVARARVVRDGKLREVDASGLVPGDIIEVDAGSSIPADARLLESVELRAVEAPLTGESMPADKRADAQVTPGAPLAERITMLYKATTLVAGRGRAVVVGTGMATEVGRIGELVSGITDQPTPLERRLDSLSRRFVVMALGVAGLVTAIGMLQGVRFGEILQTALALAVAAVPEGLPIVATIAMAVGVRRMAQRKALIRHLPVVETLGSTTIICSDKTGTLTAGEMTANVIRLDDQEVAVSGIGYTPEGQFLVGDTPVDPLGDVRLATALRICMLAGRGDLSMVDQRWTALGDPTEAALAVLARKAGLSRASLLREWPESGEVPFTNQRLLMATFHRASGELVAHVKGAPRRIVQLSTHILGAEGVREIDEAERGRLLEINRELAGRGLRVLALGIRRVAEVQERELEGLTWVGFVGISDPPAAEVKETIARFHAAGIRVVMLTGDQRLTAQRIAQDLGLLGAGQVILDATEVDRLSVDALRDVIGRAAGYSRVSPETKLRLVEAYQASGEIVAMFGDGVNDAAALRQADIGVAMGVRGTDMAKESADLILEDDRFPTIAAAIEQGRVVFANIRKFVFYLFSCNLAEIMVLLGAGLAGLPAPLLPLQILWLNLLTDTVPALALALEPAEPGVMSQPPRHPREAILSGRVGRATVGYAALISLVTLGAFVWGYLESANTAHARTMAFMTLAFGQILHLGNARSVRPVLSPGTAVSNPYALAAVVLTIALQVLTVQYQPLAGILRTHPLETRDWAILGGLAMLPAIAGQLIKTVATARADLKGEARG